MCTADSYQFFIPLFVYSIKKAYPNAGVRVFVKGALKGVTRDAINGFGFEDCVIKENCFAKYPDTVSITNTLRFLVGRDEFKGYDYVIVKDIDFLIFRGQVSHVDYFAKRMGRLPYFGIRGPYNRPRRYEVNGRGWKGSFTRVAGGTFVFKNPEWFNITSGMLSKYRRIVKQELIEDNDKKPAVSYREYDEVMLYRIIKGSGLRTPKRKGKDAYGRGMAKRYRDLHLGDFSKDKHSYKRLCKRLALVCLKQFAELERDSVWVEIRKRMSEANPKIREILRRVRKHAKRRLSSLCLSGGGIVKKK